MLEANEEQRPSKRVLSRLMRFDQQFLSHEKEERGASEGENARECLLGEVSDNRYAA